MLQVETEWSHVQKCIICSHPHVEISTYKLHVYIESHHFSAVIFYTSLWNGIRETREVRQLSFVCVRGDRDLLEPVTAQESPCWLNTLSKTEGSDKADRGALGHPKSNAGCPGPQIAPDQPHSLWSGTRNCDTIQIWFLSGPCCRFCYEQFFNLALRAVDLNLTGVVCDEKPSSQRLTHVFSPALRVVTSVCFALEYLYSYVHHCE